MSEIKFSLPEFCERYEYVRRSPDQPLISDALGNNAQRKNNYVFTLDDRTAIYDWSKAYFEVGFRVEILAPANNAERSYINGNNITITNGVTSLIRRLTLQGPNGNVLYDCAEVNKVCFLKKLLEFGPDYADSVARNELWWYDTNIASNNNGAEARKALFISANVADAPPVVKARLPLNSYSFFDSLDFNNVLLSNMSLKLIVDFETDANLIWHGAGVPDGRVVIKTFDLWVPQLTLHSSSAEKYIRSLDTPLRWSYMRERVERSPAYTLREGRFRISGVNKPKKAFFYFSQVAKEESQLFNIFTYDSMFSVVNNNGIGQNQTLQRCRLEFDDGSFYPHNEYGVEDIQRFYHDVMEYSHRNDNVCCGSILSRDRYAQLNSMVYFDLEYQKRSVVSDAKDMTFVWSLGANTAEPFVIYAILLYENDASFGRIDNQYVLLSEISK